MTHRSYSVGDDKASIAAVLDPHQDINVYLQKAQDYEMRIDHILETHIRADFISNSDELKARTEVTIYSGKT